MSGYDVFEEIEKLLSLAVRAGQNTTDIEELKTLKSKLFNIQEAARYAYDDAEIQIKKRQREQNIAPEPPPQGVQDWIR